MRGTADRAVNRNFKLMETMLSVTLMFQAKSKQLKDKDVNPDLHPK